MKKLRVLFWNNDARGFFGGPGTYVNVTQFTGPDYVRRVEFVLLTGPSGSFSGPGLEFFFFSARHLVGEKLGAPGQLPFNFTRG